MYSCYFKHCKCFIVHLRYDDWSTFNTYNELSECKGVEWFDYSIFIFVLADYL